MRPELLLLPGYRYCVFDLHVSRYWVWCHNIVLIYNTGHQVPIFPVLSYFSANSYFLLFFSKIPIFAHFSANLQLNFSFQGFFSGFIFFQCGNTCTERAVLWENFSHGVVWVRFSHKSLTNVWRSVDFTSPHPG